jgi:hypothetical protein
LLVSHKSFREWFNRSQKISLSISSSFASRRRSRSKPDFFGVKNTGKDDLVPLCGFRFAAR